MVSGTEGTKPSHINYVLFILKAAYQEFEERVGKLKSPKGEKTEIITSAIMCAIGSFRVADIQREYPSVSMDMIRLRFCLRR